MGNVSSQSRVEHGAQMIDMREAAAVAAYLDTLALSTGIMLGGQPEAYKLSARQKALLRLRFIAMRLAGKRALRLETRKGAL